MSETYDIRNPNYMSWISGTKKCPECKKKFEWTGDQWVYKGKRNGKMAYWCSWTCWRAEDKRKDKKLKGEAYRGW